MSQGRLDRERRSGTTQGAKERDHLPNGGSSPGHPVAHGKHEVKDHTLW